MLSAQDVAKATPEELKQAIQAAVAGTSEPTEAATAAVNSVEPERRKT
jgi:hypothetical protein